MFPSRSLLKIEQRFSYIHLEIKTANKRNGREGN